MVSIQYRLGAMGWLTMMDEVIPGNFGYHDQVLALKWIRDNIHAFGGDKNRVTIAGQSAGGASAHSHLLSPLSRGLFHGVIALSGVANAGWNGEWKVHRQVAHQQAQLLNCSTESSTVLLDCLRSVDARTLTLSQSDLFSYFHRTPSKIPITPYLPCIDTHSARPFLPKVPRLALREGDFDPTVPVMMGLTTQEGSWYSSTMMFQHVVDQFDKDRAGILNMLTGDGMWSPEVLPLTIDCIIE